MAQTQTLNSENQIHEVPPEIQGTVGVANSNPLFFTHKK